MKPTQNPTALQSQKWILKAMLTLIEEMDYNKINVSQICRKAQLDRRTFYRNFESKEDVLKQYIKQLGKSYMTLFLSVNNPNKYTATLLFFQFWKGHLGFIRNMRECGLSDFVFKQFEAFSKSHEALLVDEKRKSAQTEYFLAYRVGGFWNTMLTWAANNADLSPEEMATILSSA